MTRAEKVLLALLVALVAFSPVFLGGVGRFEQDWSGRDRTLLERFLLAEGAWGVIAFLSLAIAAAAVLVAREREAAGEPPVWRLHPLVLLPLAGFGAMALLQLVPLPRFLLGLLSPQADRQLDFLLPGDRSWRPLSVSPEGTWNFLAGMGVAGASLLGTLLVARRRAAALVLMGAVVGTFTLVGAYGLAETYLGEDRVLGFGKGANVGVTGTFLNRSHMAAAAALALPVALGMFPLLLRGGGKGALRAGGLPLLVAAAAILLAVVPLTHSRMGMASAAAGLLVFGMLAARATRWPWWGKGLIALLAVAVVGAGVREGLERVPELKKRFSMGVSEKGFFDIRFPAWKSTVELAARYPVLGTGLGSFETAIHETQSPDNPDELHFAHSEPLQLLSEGGGLGLALGVLLVGGVMASVLRTAGSDDPLARAAACGCGAGLAALLAGSATEFHLHIPALGIAAAVLAGIPAGRGAGEPRIPSAPPAVPRGGALLLASFLVLGAIGILHSCRGAALLAVARRAEQGGDVPGWRLAAQAAVDAAPGMAASHRSLSGALVAGDWAGPEMPEDSARALAEADRALDLEPFQPYGHWARARALLAGGRIEEAVAAIARARFRAGGIGHLHFAAGRVLLSLSLERPELRSAALDAFGAAGECEPRYFTGAFHAVQEAGLPLEDNTGLVPDRIHAWNAWANLMRSAGKSQAEFQAVRRLWLLDDSDRVRAALLEAGERAGRLEEARSLLSRGH